jgi:hypothetical protein
VTERRVTLVAWNPHTGNTAARITDRLDAEVRRDRPMYFALDEVKRHRDALSSWARRNGYRLLQEQPLPERAGEPVPEHGSTALLVDARHPDIEPLSSRVIPMKLPWKVFSHDRWHRPRRFQRDRSRVYGIVVKTTASHWPTSGFTGGNRVAFAEAAGRAAAAILTRGRGVVALDVGDHNTSVSSLVRWAKALRAVVVGKGPDSLIAAGARKVRHEVGPKDGSDHHLMRYKVWL